MNEVYRDIDQHIPYLRRYAGALAQNPAAADDLVQDSVVNALSKFHLYRPGTNLRAWLFTILRNQHISNVRRKSRTGVAVDPDDVASALATQPNQEHNLTLEAVQKALRSLPDGQRDLIEVVAAHPGLLGIGIEVVALDGQSYEDVAKRYGLALGTVKSRISRGRSQLRKALESGTGAQEPHDRPDEVPGLRKLAA